MSFWHRLDKALHRLYGGCGIVAAGLVVLIAGLVLVNIVSRFLGTFVPGMTEGAGYAMAGAGALGLAYTFGEHGHIRVTMVIQRFRGRARFGLELWAAAAAGAMLCYLAYFLLRMVWVSYLFEDRSDGSDELLIWIPQLPMALGFTVFAISVVHAVVAGWVTGQIAGMGGDEAPPTTESGT